MRVADAFFIENSDIFGRRLFYRNVGIYVLRTDKCEVKNVSSTCQWNQEAQQVASGQVSYKTLDTHHDSKTANHSHKYTRCHSSVFAKTFGSEVEDTTPHNRCAKTYEQEHQDAYRHVTPHERQCCVVNARNAYCDVGRQEDAKSQLYYSRTANR